MVRECRRSPSPDPSADVVLLDLLSVSDWSAALDGVDVVVHLAARVHQMQERGKPDEAAYRAMNVDACRRLIEQAAALGVRRFVFVSSIKVNGERSPGRPLTEADAPCPVEAYAKTKYEAEQILRAHAEAHGMDWVVLRPPLVYGPGVKGNFERLVRLVRHGVPLPASKARRSYVSVWSLTDLILLACTHPAAANQVFLAQDVTWTTAQLVRQLASAMGRTPCFLPLPPWLAGLLIRIPLGRGIFMRLCGELEVSSDKARQTLGWNPSMKPEEGLARTVASPAAGLAAREAGRCS